jgi:subtilisin family serine protease
MKRLAALIATLALLGAMFPALVSAAGPRTAMIVVFNDGVANPAALAAQLSRAHGFETSFIYTTALGGFAAELAPAAARALSNNPNVAWVEADGMAYPTETTQLNPTWGLDRIDQEQLPLDSRYVYDNDGAGVDVYVIDSGIRFSHSEFEGRVHRSLDLVGDGQDGDDCNGHGTHVAGTIGGKLYGVAKKVALHSVRVFGCSGGTSWSTVISAVDHVTQRHNAKKVSDPATSSVANMSLGGGGNTSVDSAVRNSVEAGVTYAVAAGNGNIIGRQDDACKYSPARVREALTISATNSSDQKASWANYGNCVDLFAPGVSITSAWHTSNTATNTISGTSMASPHAAGVAALYLNANPGTAPATVHSDLRSLATTGVVTSSNTSNPLLLHSRIGGGGGDADPTPPPAPTGLSATAGDASVTLAWGASAGAESYRVYRSTSSSSLGSEITTVATTGYTDTSVTNDVTYYYRVTALAENLESAPSNQASATPTAPGEPPGGGPSTVLTAMTEKSGPQWIAYVSIRVVDGAGEGVAGISVEWSWSSNAGGSPGSCETDGSGHCPLVDSTQHNRVGSITFNTVALHGSDSLPISKP